MAYVTSDVVKNKLVLGRECYPRLYCTFQEFEHWGLDLYTMNSNYHNKILTNTKLVIFWTTSHHQRMISFAHIPTPGVEAPVQNGMHCNIQEWSFNQIQNIWIKRRSSLFKSERQHWRYTLFWSIISSSFFKDVSIEIPGCAYSRFITRALGRNKAIMA